ncbi:Gfo/Idh/MocA family oxidoreductase [Candidatus Peregrinibacteria bacterium]|nr:Gfo/Idh/MocA family oxidoreductase [Candidatus Peregrinibacteria bacterium]MBI3816077.1 Gfo/Idh/MocA family oxidoreductase [Candidatus Peregrinibacteria bacterium]
MRHSPLRIGVIGYGYWGPNLVRNFHARLDAEVAAVADVDEQKLAQVHLHYPSIQCVSDAISILHDPRIDAVAIATPPSTHFALARKALEIGKHVLVEKPMAMTSIEAQALIGLARARKRILMVGHTFIYTSSVQKIRSLIENGELGDLYYIDSVRFNLGLLQGDASVLWDLAPHDLSIFLYLVDERPTAVQAFGQVHIGAEKKEIATVTIRYESGFHAHIHVSWISPVKIRLTLIGGSRKMIVYDDVEPTEKVRIYDKGVSLKESGESVTAFNPIYRAGDVLIPALDRREALEREISHFLNCIQMGVTPLSDGESGLAVIRILEAAEMSMAQNGAFVPLSR